MVAGCEDGLLPSWRSTSAEQKEEERRLFFVGMTRAKQLLYLRHVSERAMFGRDR